LQLQEVAVELDAVRPERLHGETQENGCAAGVALVDDADVLRAVLQHGFDVGHCLRGHVGIDAAIGTFETELVAVAVVQAPVSLDGDGHASSCCRLLRVLVLFEAQQARASIAYVAAVPGRLDIITPGLVSRRRPSARAPCAPPRSPAAR